MRKIKFRAWHKGRKEWLHDKDEACHILGEMILLGGWCRVPIEELNDVEVTQYIGLKDSQGVEIWEQDIVQRGDELSVVEYDSWHGDWEEGGATYGFYLPWMPISSTPVTVVGNIFEHPELKAQTIK